MIVFKVGFVGRLIFQVDSPKHGEKKLKYFKIQPIVVASCKLHLVEKYRFSW
jgi:hypothetical protein